MPLPGGIITCNVRSMLVGIFTESLLKVVLPAFSLAALFKNLRHCVL